MKYSLIIPTVSQTILVKTCIESVRKYEPHDDEYEFIIIDDGSDQKVQHWLKGNFANDKNTKVILKSENRGFAHTVNIGLKAAVGEHLILLNNDVSFIKPTLRYIDQNFKDQPHTGIIGAKLLFPPGHRVQHAGVVRAPMGRASFVHINKHTNRTNESVCQNRYFPSVTGALYAIRRECWEAVGDWNENYFLSCEDTEYSLRCWAAGWHVFYNANVEAIHIEGHTRGNTDELKKRKNMTWFLKERQTIPKFSSDIVKYDVEGIDRRCHELNSTLKPLTDIDPLTVGDPSQYVPKQPVEPPPPPRAVKKLEVGCGTYGQPGYIHLDIRKLDGVDVVCDFGNERLPFEDGEIDEILSNHSIEHISWRKLPHVLKEWHRVLRPGGKVFFRTPDLEFICKTYLEGKTTKEHPNDEGYVTGHLASRVTPAWWANSIK